ncbi:MAG: DNA repair protein RadC, partial [Lentisphaerae bacterium]|nr:DNA repair protein RadC [Lentisphaerota bacterium]
QVLKAALELARRMTEESQAETELVRTPDDAARLLRETARPLNHEVFWVLLLNAKNRLMGAPKPVTKGLLDASLIHPREVFQEAIQRLSSAVLVVHNHPSGDPSPSAEDIQVTRQLVEAGKVLGIRVLDHVILGKASGDRASDFYSLRQAGIVEFAG